MPHLKYLWVRPSKYDDLGNPMQAAPTLREVCFNHQAPAFMGLVGRNCSVGAK
ncbi:MAG: hypothetical protein ACK4LB_04370 [Spirosomataceae bacterium]